MKELLINLGIHSEGSIIRTLIGLLFLDLIYTLPAPDLLIDIFQTEPLDFHTDAFYKSRQEQIDERISQLNSEEVKGNENVNVKIKIEILFRISKKLRRKTGICIT